MIIEFSRFIFHVVFMSLRKGSKMVFFDAKKSVCISLNIKILLCRVKFYELMSSKVLSFSRTRKKYWKSSLVQFYWKPLFYCVFWGHEKSCFLVKIWFSTSRQTCKNRAQWQKIDIFGHWTPQWPTRFFLWKSSRWHIGGGLRQH